MTLSPGLMVRKLTIARHLAAQAVVRVLRLGGRTWHSRTKRKCKVMDVEEYKTWPGRSS